MKIKISTRKKKEIGRGEGEMKIFNGTKQTKISPETL